jgi:ribosomal protein S18 acetylase RimI-like enzyme
MKYKDFYKHLLTEGRKDDVLNKLKKIGRESDLDKLMSLDKTTTKKHAVKLADYYVEVKDFGIIESYYNRFIENGNLNTKDINQWKTFKDFENIVDSSNVKVSKTFGEIEEKPIYEDDKIRVFHGDSKEKCIKLSNGYTFCIGRNDSGNLYNHYRYNAETTFYFIRFKEKSNSITIASDGYDDNDHYIVIQMLTNGKYFLTVANNIGDREITKNEIINKYPETKVLFDKNLIKPLPHTEREKHIIKNIRGKSFHELDNDADRLIWCEINPSSFMSDFDFKAPYTSQSIIKKYIETRTVDLPRMQVAWLKESSPKMFERYVDVKNNQLSAKIKAGGFRPTEHEIYFAREPLFIEYLKSDEYDSALEIVGARGTRGGETAKLLLEFCTIGDNFISSILNNGLVKFGVDLPTYFRENERKILHANKKSIIFYYIHYRFDRIQEIHPLFSYYNDRDDLTYLFEITPSGSDPMKILDMVERVSPENYYRLLGNDRYKKRAIRYIINRYKDKMLEFEPQIVYWILFTASYMDEKYFIEVEKELLKYVSKSSVDAAKIDVVDTIDPQGETRRLEPETLKHLNVNENTSTDLASLRSSLLSKGVDNFLSEKDGTIYLSKIRISKPNRGKGLGTQAMRDITDYADKTNQIIVLSPDTSLGGTSVDRLRSFYKRFGFKDNRGGKKNFKYSETMIRYPISSQLNESIEVKYVQDGQIQDEDDVKISDFNEQIHQLEKTSNISILRNKELSVVLVEDGVVLGALYTELSNSSKGEEFSFDVIVHPEYRNKGLGDKLVQIGLNDYKSIKNSYSDKIKLKIDVVNPILINTFKKYGLKIIKQDGGHTIMTL